MGSSLIWKKRKYFVSMFGITKSCPSLGVGSNCSPTYDALSSLFIHNLDANILIDWTTELYVGRNADGDFCLFFIILIRLK